MYVEDSENPVRSTNEIFEGNGLFTKVFTSGGPRYSDYMYLLYLDREVAAWYICGHDLSESFIIVSARDYEIFGSWLKAKQAFLEAEGVIRMLKLGNIPRVSAECPSWSVKATLPGWFSLPLDPGGLHTLYWTTDDHSITMELHSKAPSSSWMALGFSDSGRIDNADLCMVWTDSDGIHRFQDVWTDEEGTVHVDEQQDCLFQGYKHNNDVTISVFSRKLDTCDVHDAIVEEGTMRLVWATGPGPIASAEKQPAAAAKHGSVSTRLMRPLHADPPLPADVWTFDVAQDSFRVPESDVYWCKVVQLPEAFKRKHHIVKFETRVTPGNEHLVHHMILKQCAVILSTSDGPCDIRKLHSSCTKVLAMGMQDFSFPQEAGFSLGGSEAPIHAVLEIHYTPPDKTKDWVDSSGLRVHVTPTLRQFDADLLELGLQYLGETALPPGQQHFHATSRCVAPCTEISLPPEGITIFASRLHAHTSAVGIVTRHMRGGRELGEVVRENHYNVYRQPLWRLRRNVKVLPGDELITTCRFDTTKLSNVTLTGLGPTDEMCLNIVYYYPKMALALCKSSVSEHGLNQYFRKNNKQVDLSQKLAVRHVENFRKILWTKENVQELEDLYRLSSVDALCYWKGSRHVPLFSNMSVMPLQSLATTSSRCTTDGVRGL